MVFNENAPEYRTCCCHAKTGTVVIGVLALVGLKGQVIKLIISQADTVEKTISITCIFIGFLVLGFLFFGIRKEKANFLIPYMILQIMAIMGLIVLVISSIATAVRSQEMINDLDAYKLGPSIVDEAKYVRTVAVIMIFASAIFFVFGIWFFAVILKCYHYFKDKEEAKYGNAPVPLASKAEDLTYEHLVEDDW